MTILLSKLSPEIYNLLNQDDLFKSSDSDSEYYLYKININADMGITIHDYLGRFIPIDWSDVPEFSQAFKVLETEASKYISLSNFNT